ncbi:potassium-transporting ATPase subunit KdpA [Legionella clemsonensis]|uniref:Potassium-transporting ATPase potassium-binding subunit n=1 Tax=Legionella clemsonensis TaxID=1867846 RepID=A0A222P2S8_9GAMM|nr:potassium-transporting ATPase subunit KdpA [Legionella clemsonensis]ASQ46158.1 Potassium-transporting ATPase A chain [Legionella clemsonensis]
MLEISILQVVLYFFVLLLLIKPLGWYMRQVYENRPCGLNWLGRSLERGIYRLCNINPEEQMSWKNYLSAMLIFNLLGLLIVYLIQRLQFYLPLNPQKFVAPSPYLSFNTAVSFITNTNWQAYSGEETMSYFTQMLALAVQNFISAATGMSVLVAVIRGIAKHEESGLGNFWVDMVRSILYILLPLSLILAVILTSQGVIQNFKPYEKFIPLQGESQAISLQDTLGNNIQESQVSSQMEAAQQMEQLIPMGPVASQVAIKQLGSNGGGFFNTNSAHPFENPTPLTNFLEMLALLLIPASLCYTFGLMVHDKRQGWAILIAMAIMFIPGAIVAIVAEHQGNPALVTLDVDSMHGDDLYPAGNMEGKETRIGIVSSALWATATTAASNGSVNAMHDSFTPLGGLVQLWMMQLGEIVFGGVGSGLYSMLVIVIITVFVAGLMVGRTPEYLGKKIEPYEIKMASFVVLLMPVLVLITTAMGAVTPMGVRSIANPGAHGFTEILYAFTSMGNNNGSAFAGLNANTPFYTLVGAVSMLISRFWIAIPVMAIAGSLVRKKRIPISSGTLATHTPLFIILLVGISLIVGALAFLPALSLGPIVEQLMLWREYG